MGDRILLLSFSLSLGLHLLLFLGQLLSWPWFKTSRLRTMTEIIYDYAVVQHEVRQLQEQLARAKRETVATSAPISGRLRTQIRIAERPSLAQVTSLSQTPFEHTTLIDLSNLTETARGDPVRLAYFSAMRDQIQAAANRREWLTGETQEGMVYVSFIVTSNGAVQQVSVLADRSVPSRTLQETARRIIDVASPFLPFPPSMQESTQTVVIPLEFLLGL